MARSMRLAIAALTLLANSAVVASAQTSGGPAPGGADASPPSVAPGPSTTPATPTPPASSGAPGGTQQNDRSTVPQMTPGQDSNSCPSRRRPEPIV